jgi:DNA-binding NarL/FixJ family response regulator
MKLLIVEDSHLLRGRLAAFFADFPALEVAAAATTVLGVARFREWLPDIAILDIQLPDGSGIDVLKTIKRERPSTRVLMFSNHVTCQRQCQTEGADWFFDKASDFEALAATVRALAQGTSTGATGGPST